MGAIALDPAHSGDRLRSVFIAQFGNEPDTESDRLALTASNAVAGREASLWSRDPVVFWDSRREAYRRVTGPDALDEIAGDVRAGLIWPALDDGVVFQDRDGVLLFASGAGATTFYHTEVDGVVLFASRLPAIRAARTAPIDRLGLGEIVRFGANYGRRTLLQNVHRIPLGHVLDCKPGSQPTQRAFMDYSYRPREDATEVEMREAIGAALDLNLGLIEGKRDLLFSGGVDSALLGLRGVATDTVRTGWFYAVEETDPELAIAREAAQITGLDLRIVSDATTPEEIMRRIAAYSLPTLDFSIVPTHALGSAIAEAHGRTTLIDGTGGDAWFGFRSFAHAGAWPRLQRLNALSPLARQFYMRALVWEDRPALRPLKGLARTPRLPNAGLGHLCANPVYSELLDLDRDEWLAIERDIVAVMHSLTGGEPGGPEGEVVVADACMIAVAQFAAKTGQWDVAEQAATFYPFLMPNMVALGRTVPSHMLVREGTAKPLLKDMVAASPLGRDFAYRRKSGFQPPLQRLLQNESAREILFDGIGNTADVVPWSPAARRLPKRLLQESNSLRIGGLYAIWAQLVIELWLKSLRQL